MRCDEGRITAFLHGELPDRQARAFDEHLLTCESCWRAVQEDRAGRLAIERLRSPAPLGLADRVSASIGLAAREPGGDVTVPGRRVAHQAGRAQVRMAIRVAVAAVAAVIVVAGSVLGWSAHDHQPADPPQIARVLAMDSAPAATSPALVAGEHFVFGGQPLTVRAYRVEGITTLVATSSSPFPMPASSHLVAGSSRRAWMATRGTLAIYGVNRPAGGGHESMFLVAAMPMARLPQVAAQLHLT